MSFLTPTTSLSDDEMRGLQVSKMDGIAKFNSLEISLGEQSVQLSSDLDAVKNAWRWALWRIPQAEKSLLVKDLCDSEFGTVVHMSFESGGSVTPPGTPILKETVIVQGEPQNAQDQVNQVCHLSSLLGD